MQLSVYRLITSAAPRKFFHRSAFNQIRSPPLMAHLKVALEQDIRCEDVVKIAEKAAEAIISVYNSKVGSTASAPIRSFHLSTTHRTHRTLNWSFLQDEDWNVERKADNSPLTRADQEANTIICAGLAALGEFYRSTHNTIELLCSFWLPKTDSLPFL